MNFVNPLISVIITTKNSEFNIENSILSALNQTYKNIEIIIVDHDSEDKTLEICKKFNHLPFFYILNNHDSKNLIFKDTDINAGFSSRNLGNFGSLNLFLYSSGILISDSFHLNSEISSIIS